MPIALGEIRTCSSGICTHFASDYTLTAGTPPVSRNKHFRHSPVSSIARETVMHETPQLLSEGARHQASARTSAESDEACQRETKDKADGMRERRGHCLRRDLNLYLWDTRPSCFRLLSIATKMVFPGERKPFPFHFAVRASRADSQLTWTYTCR